MKKEYQEVLDFYIDLESKTLSQVYLDKFWLNYCDYTAFWLPVKNNIFRADSKDLPNLMFNNGFEIIAQRGGILFSKDEYYALQNCMRNAGDTNFVLIENNFARNTECDFPHLRFKFPIETTWEELNNGDEKFPDISFETIYIMNKHFFVYGDSGKWGKYAASNYNYSPLDIIGYKPELSTIIQKNFKQSKEEKKEIRKWLPQQYKVLIKE